MYQTHAASKMITVRGLSGIGLIKIIYKALMFR